MVFHRYMGRCEYLTTIYCVFALFLTAFSGMLCSLLFPLKFFAQFWVVFQLIITDISQSLAESFTSRYHKSPVKSISPSIYLPLDPIYRRSKLSIIGVFSLKASLSFKTFFSFLKQDDLKKTVCISKAFYLQLPLKHTI